MEPSTIINGLFILFAIWFIYTRFAPAKGLRTLTATQFGDELKQQNNAILIDVREPQEYKSGSIPGANNIPLSQLKHRIAEIPQDKQAYLFCQSGMRSKQAARILVKQGYTGVSHLQGGISAWRNLTR